MGFRSFLWYLTSLGWSILPSINRTERYFSHIMCYHEGGVSQVSGQRVRGALVAAGEGDMIYRTWAVPWENSDWMWLRGVCMRLEKFRAGILRSRAVTISQSMGLEGNEATLLWARVNHFFSLVLLTWVGQRSGDIYCLHLRSRRKWKANEPTLPSSLMVWVFLREGKSRAWISRRRGKRLEMSRWYPYSPLLNELSKTK